MRDRIIPGKATRVNIPKEAQEELFTEEQQQIKRGRGVTKAIPLEKYLWLLRGTKDEKLDRLVLISEVYNDVVNPYTMGKYFYPAPEVEKDTIDSKSINEFILRYNGTLYWEDKYKDLMHSIDW